MAKLSSKAFNNIIIIGVLVFISAMNLPKILRSSSTEQTQQTDYPKLLPEQSLLSLQFSDVILKKSIEWEANRQLTISAEDLVARWRALEGTKVDESILLKLQQQLPVAQTFMVEVKNQPAFALTYYEFSDFWLFQNWQRTWLAISVDKHYLFPLAEVN